MRTSLRAGGTAVLAALLVAGAAAGHELTAPATVEADGSGHFAYEVVVVITEPVEFAWVTVDGNDNTDIGAWTGDGFCLEVIEPGVYPYMIEGNLRNAGRNGSVYYAHAMCDRWWAESTTTVEAPGVDAGTTSWGSVKGRYR